MKQDGHPPQSDRDGDAPLAEIFDEAHRDDSPPSFSRLFARHRVKPARRRLAWASLATTAAAALAIAVWLRSRPGPARSPAQLARATAVPPDANVARIEQFASSLDHWRAPTDFLLDTPGMDLLTGTPHLDFTTFTFADWHQTEEKKL